MPDSGHPLQGFLRNAKAAQRSTVVVEVLPPQDAINLRGDPENKAFVTAVSKVLRQDLPLAANTFTEEYRDYRDQNEDRPAKNRGEP